MQDLHGLQDAHAWARAYSASHPSSKNSVSPGTQLPPEETATLIIPQLLSAEEVADCHAAAAELGGSSPFAGGGLNDMLSGLPHDVAYSDEHIAIYLHQDSFLQECRPALSSKLLQAMRSQPGDWGDPGLALHVRCIELHRCA